MSNRKEIWKMNAAYEMLCTILSKKKAEINVSFSEIPDINAELSEIVERIRAVIADEESDDYMCVEKIIVILEEYGISCGSRHD